MVEMTANDMVAKINEALERGRRVQVTTYLTSTLYGPKHAGWFEARGGKVKVRHGRGWNTLAYDTEEGLFLLVRIEFHA